MFAMKECTDAKLMTSLHSPKVEQLENTCFLSALKEIKVFSFLQVTGRTYAVKPTQQWIMHACYLRTR